MNKNRILIAVVGLAAFAFIYSYKTSHGPLRPVAGTSGEAYKKKSLPETRGTKPSETVAGEASTPGAAPSSAPAEFVAWFSDEAKELDRVHVDGEQKQRDLRSRVARLTSPEADHLSRTARNPSASAAEKIFATYLLVEGGLHTQGQLAALIVAPFQEAADYAPHTDGEMKGIREKSLRIMAIDGLFSRAQSDPEARRELARVANEAQEPSVRAYATDKLRQLR